jgi:hypothetical protein
VRWSPPSPRSLPAEHEAQSRSRESGQSSLPRPRCHSSARPPHLPRLRQVKDGGSRSDRAGPGPDGGQRTRATRVPSAASSLSKKHSPSSAPSLISLSLPLRAFPSSFSSSLLAREGTKRRRHMRGISGGVGVAVGWLEATKRRRPALAAGAGGGHRWSLGGGSRLQPFEGRRPGAMGEIDWVLPTLGIPFICAQCRAAAVSEDEEPLHGWRLVISSRRRLPGRPTSHFFRPPGGVEVRARAPFCSSAQ